jgi:hypothetical protein
MRSNTTLAKIIAGKSARDGRDKKLWSLLPAKDAPYDYDKLSKAETDALVEALADGFGDVLVQGSVPLPIPSKVKSGLLEHFIYGSEELTYEAEECGDDALNDAFLNEALFNIATDDDAPRPYEVFPLAFHRRRLRVYFRNQFKRFCEQLCREDQEWASSLKDRYPFEWEACRRLYEKPWYEFHALQYLDWMELSVKDISSSKHAALDILSVSTFSGQLGRLVEQYYWRFRFERVAITGAGAQKGASAGGRAKAELHQNEQSVWQNMASEIWAHQPGLSKAAVAEIIRKKSGRTRTAKHIARYITHR